MNRGSRSGIGVPTRLLLGCDAMGYAPLREAIADYLNTSCGARYSAEQIAVVSGVQSALDLTARALRIYS